MSAAELRPGVVLLAETDLVDPNFEEAVVLLCAHDEGGSLGLILNRPLDVPLSRLLPDADACAELGMGLSWGGPVALEKLHALHGGPAGLDECIAVCPGVEFGGVLEELLEVHEQGRPVRFFLGYTGWDGGQLDGEMAEGTWRVAPGGPEVAFDPDPAALWGRLMAQQDPGLRWLRHRPDTPEVN